MSGQAIFVITGPKASGKTTTATETAIFLSKKGKRVTGILSPGEWHENLRTGYAVSCIGSGISMDFASNIPVPGWQHLGGFWFNPAAAEFGRECLLSVPDPEMVIIDEVGRFDMQGHLWGDFICDHTGPGKPALLITVRDIFLEEVLKHWGLHPVKIFILPENDIGHITDTILPLL